MISDINKGTTASKVISFADDTRVFSNIAQVDDCDNFQSDLNIIYNWALQNNMFFNSQKFDYISYSSSLSSNSYNVFFRGSGCYSTFGWVPSIASLIIIMYMSI